MPDRNDDQHNVFTLLPLDLLPLISQFLSPDDFLKFWWVLRLSSITEQTAMDILDKGGLKVQFAKAKPFLFEKIQTYYLKNHSMLLENECQFWQKQCKNYNIFVTDTTNLHVSLVKAIVAKELAQVKKIADELTDSEFLSALLKPNTFSFANEAFIIPPYSPIMMGFADHHFLNRVYEKYRHYPSYTFTKINNFSRLILAVICRQSNYVLAQIVQEEGVNDHALYFAARYGNAQAVSYFMGLPYGNKAKLLTQHYQEALDLACGYNHTAVIEVLVSNRSLEVSSSSWESTFKFGNYDAFNKLKIFIKPDEYSSIFFGKEYSYKALSKKIFEYMGQYGYLDLLKSLLELYIDKVNDLGTCREKIKISLYKAIEYGQHHVVSYLFELMQRIKTPITDYLQTEQSCNKTLYIEGTPLHFAAKKSNAGMLNYLVTLPEIKVLVNSKDRLLQTPLHLASCFGTATMVKILLKHGATLGQVTSSNENEFDFALKNHREDLILYYLQNHPAICDKAPELLEKISFVFENGLIKLAKYLLENYPKLHTKTYSDSKGCQRPLLQIATKNQQLTMVKLLIQQGAQQGIKAEADGKDEFDIALEIGATPLIEYYLQKVRIKAYDEKDNFCKRVRVVFEKGYIEAASYLLDQNPKLIQWTGCLNAACERGHVELVKLLINRNVHVDPQQLYYACKESESADIVKQLATKIANINEQDSADNTVLHSLLIDTKENDLVAVNIINSVVAAGLRLDLKNKNGVSVAELLLEKYVFVEEGSDYNSRYDKNNVVEMILSHSTDFHFHMLRNPAKATTRLHLACMLFGDSFIKKELQRADINVNAKDGEGNTPLHIALKERSLLCGQPIPHLLITNNADEKILNLKGERPIDIIKTSSNTILTAELTANQVMLPFLNEAYKAKPSTEILLVINLLVVYCKRGFYSYHIAEAKEFLQYIFNTPNVSVDDIKTKAQKLTQNNTLRYSMNWEANDDDAVALNREGAFWHICKFISQRNLKAYLVPSAASHKTTSDNKNMLEQYRRFGLFQWRHHRSEASQLLQKGDDLQQGVKDLCSNQQFKQNLNPTGDFAKILYRIRFG